MKLRQSEFIRHLRAGATEAGWNGAHRTRVPLDDIRTAFRKVNNRNPDGEYEPLLMSRQLDELEDLGLIEQFKQRTRDKVSLPVKIWLCPTAPPRPAVPPMPHWHPDLYRLAGEWPTATPKQRAAYVAVNQWLMGDPDLFPVPLRERALEIFGTYGSEADFPMPEKTFDTLRSGTLFGDSTRLHATLRTFTTHPPLLAETFLNEIGDGYYQRVGSGDILLVVENSATWWSLVHSLPSKHRLGYVAWGLGGTFRASVNTLAAKHHIAEIRYFGDLDLSGIRIPHAASKTSIDRGHPSVQPAECLYGALLELGRARGAKEKSIEAGEACALAEWMPRAYRARAVGLLVAGQRLAQEWVGYRYLTRDTAWHADLV
ncbi:Wadjet anti-phage system protein JetD domain-containing protein [Streptomyces fildesensis]|uniref:Wadjet anti-phage system protein JetD domain-containing protein n=1 Tax=Streptomyces fildesensis TaxID=375757 RepID=A0ABW8C275_9ACTN